MLLYRAFVKVKTMLSKPNTDWVTICKILLHTAVPPNEAKRTTSGEYGLASVPEYEAGTEDSPSSEMQLTVGTLYIYCRK